MNVSGTYTKPTLDKLLILVGGFYKALLDSQGRFSVTQLDNVVKAFYEGDSATRAEAQVILTEFQNNSESWQLVDQVLERSQNVQSKFLALRVLHNFVLERWKHLPPDRRLAIRNYIVDLIVLRSSTKKDLQSEKPFLTKLNMVLVQIIKKEWPDEWPTFTEEIIAASKANLSLCENNMRLLRLLSEEVFDVSEEEQAQWKTRRLSEQMAKEFGPVFDLCCQILEKVTDPSLLQATLETVLKFFAWIPVSSMFETSLMRVLEHRLVSGPRSALQNQALKCFIEIVTVDHLPIEYQSQLSLLLDTVIEAVHRILTSVNLKEYQDLNSLDQELLQDYAVFLSEILTRYQQVIASLDINLVHRAHNDLLLLSDIDDRELWRVCLEYWSKLAHQVRELPSTDSLTAFNDVFRKLRRITVNHMVNPDEVLIISEDDGQVVDRKFVRQSDAIELYRSMQSLLCDLTVLDPRDMEVSLKAHFIEQLHAFGPLNNPNRVCWAVGAIADALTEEAEESLLGTFMMQLERLLLNNNSKDHEWIAASCMLYICGSYPRFLNKHADLFQSILSRILVYLHEPEFGIREMACDSLVKICSSCKNMLQGTSLFQELLSQLPSLIADLEPLQTSEVYRAIGYVVSVAPLEYQQQQIAFLMKLPNESLKTILQADLGKLESLKILLTILRTNLSVCSSIGPGYGYQLKYIYMDLVAIYQALSPEVRLDHIARLRERVREQVNELLQSYIENKSQLDEDDRRVVNVLVNEFVIAPPGKHDVSDILSTMLAKHFHREETHSPQALPPLIETVYYRVFERIYAEINGDFETFYEKRPGFFKLVHALIAFAWTDVLKLPREKFTLVVESFLWGIQHPDHAISNQAYETCIVFLNNVAQETDDDLQNALYEHYYMRILSVILAVITDRDRRNQFELQSLALARLLDLVQQGEIYTKLYPEGHYESNAAYVQAYIKHRLRGIYPTLPENQIDLVASGMLEYSDDLERFCKDLVDFMADFRSVDDFAKQQEVDLETELELWRSL